MKPSTKEAKHSVYGLAERVGIKTIRSGDSKEWGGDFLKWWLASRLMPFGLLAVILQCSASPNIAKRQQSVGTPA